MQIAELSSQPHRLDDAVNYFWGCWGNTSNFDFYRYCIAHSLQAENLLPKFYLALENNSIIGSYALLVNDLVSRQDLSTGAFQIVAPCSMATPAPIAINSRDIEGF